MSDGSSMEERIEQIFILMNGKYDFSITFCLDSVSKIVQVSNSQGVLKTMHASTYEECLDRLYSELRNETEEKLAKFENNIVQMRERLSKAETVVRVGVG